MSETTTKPITKPDTKPGTKTNPLNPTPNVNPAPSA